MKQGQQERLLRTRDVAEILCLAVSTVNAYASRKTNRVPTPIKIGNLSYWKGGDIDELKNAMLAGKSIEELQELCRAIDVRNEQLKAGVVQAAGLKADSESTGKAGVYPIDGKGSK